MRRRIIPAGLKRGEKVESGTWVKLSDKELTLVISALELYERRSTSPNVWPLVHRLRAEQP